MPNRTVQDLIARSNRLGADPRNTNYAGGNTSAKGTDAASVASLDNSRKYEPTKPPTRAAVTLSGWRSTINAKSNNRD